MITIGRITLTVVKRFQAENKPGLGEWAWRSGLNPLNSIPGTRAEGLSITKNQPVKGL
jgi:hypothetical protein